MKYFRILHVALLTQLSILGTHVLAIAGFDPVSVVRRDLLPKQEIHLPTLDKLKVTYRAYREFIKDLHDSNQESAYSVIKIELDAITQDQFKELTLAFGGTSKVKYVPDERYSLTDFLPPLFQALDHHTYSGKAEPNCAGTALGLVDPASENFYAFSPHQIIADEFLSNSKYSHSVGLSELETKKIEKRLEIMKALTDYRTSQEGEKAILEFYKNHEDPESIRCSTEIGGLASPEVKTKIAEYQQLLASTFDLRNFGDILAVSEKDYFRKIDEASMKPVFESVGGSVHLAIAIDGNLFFEKPDPGRESPFRLRILKDIEQTKSFPRTNPEVTYQYRRIKPEVEKVTVQTLGTVLSDQPYFGSVEKNFRKPYGSGEEGRLQCHPIAFDPNGRAYFK